MAKNTMIEQLCTAEQVLISFMVVREPVDSRFHIIVTTGVNGITMTLSENEFELTNQRIEFLNGNGRIGLTESEFETVSDWFNAYNTK
ncbi:hypothetical protein [Vibrio parahaemolyticus]|uniref:hypothetical protein n=1 Tax=Vibrio parahaemolyticus TaxID=670 RepID=UPI00112211B2|nr:hypothetical protein [Vibrio parahaemolyticus]UJW92792.1 hypothetical protein JHS83_25190 [Vibrio parahaemolyticus]UJX06957.1 hypothetical protein JHS88_24840 [Vibrio parahaemolyticus]UJX06980.1 hypothetical protein JHS88_25370 [Vibrio parahaemolyticus]WCZ09812.1 hypothetical protein GSR97_26520 [Vibrio parahaemolyticus]WCZ14723.1 hypothetical protein GSS20_25735 [Vibrio parahaemolyticus]